ncbi:uncharacterized protein L201_004555 [Kwoniella dendrophila CBS 6074]|uniref:Mandelate racemase/muconate lactonizing enzyme C-terminal domain-containing protein n=1 Tax=Kwoniella dendrophila CBS 6074 TaxID=1295534 RepID=A0AAX4JYH8_9TREE
MKVTKIEIYECSILRRHPHLAGKGIGSFCPVIVRVTTDEGISGIGEVGLAFGAGAKAASGMLRDLAKYVLGKDPMKIEAIWEAMYRQSFWGMGGGPVVYGGMSAYDIALWDIKGKKLGVPLYQLLGGKSNQSLRSYASQIQFGWGEKIFLCSKPEHFVECSLAAVADGFDAIKVDPLQVDRNGLANFGPNGYRQDRHGLLRADDIAMGVERIAAIREAVGPNVDIILELHSLLGTHSATQFIKACEPYGIYYCEEPVNPMNPKAMIKVAQDTNTPIATGERSYTRWGFREMLENQALAVVQPDLCLVGGLTEGKKICDLANIYDATVQIHVCGSPITTAAALHLETAIPNFIIHEEHTYASKLCMQELCTNDYQPVNGRHVAPELPGLGQDLNEDVMKDYLVATIE